MIGFISGEGCFYVKINKSKSLNTGFQVSLVFIVAQHSRDTILFDSIKNYLDCGVCSVNYDGSVIYLIVKRFADITEKIIPFFHKYPILGEKSKDFNDFCLIAELMKNKAHLTEEGLNQIRQIKAGMNTGRKFFRSRSAKIIF